MAKDPWTDPDPQPGDFDAEVEAMDPHDIQVVEAGNGANVTVVINVSGEDAARLDELATERGKGVDEVVAELVRNA
jgi:hypothetical protein